MHRSATLLVAALFFSWHRPSSPPSPRAPQALDPRILGRWDVTVHGTNGDYPSWLEVKESGNRILVGEFVGRFGSARPISRLAFTGDTLRFSLPPQWERGDSDLLFEGRLQDDKLGGTTTDADGTRRQWQATRAPDLGRAAAPVWGKPTALIGKDLSGWRRSAGSNWSVAGGVLRNAKAGDNLVTTHTFGDFKLHVEFRYPPGSNSGVYLRGRYEVQVEDSSGIEPATNHQGGVYGFLAPTVDAGRPPGQWQTYDITLVGRVVTVVLNGKRVICEREIPGITGGALDSDEGSPGPIYLQGDHGPIEYRNIVVTSAR